MGLFATLRWDRKDELQSFPRRASPARRRAEREHRCGGQEGEGIPDGRKDDGAAMATLVLTVGALAFGTPMGRAPGAPRVPRCAPPLVWAEGEQRWAGRRERGSQTEVK